MQLSRIVSGYLTFFKKKKNSLILFKYVLDLCVFFMLLLCRLIYVDFNIM